MLFGRHTFTPSPMEIDFWAFRPIHRHKQANKSTFSWRSSGNRPTYKHRLNTVENKSTSSWRSPGNRPKYKHRLNQTRAVENKNTSSWRSSGNRPKYKHRLHQTRAVENKSTCSWRSSGKRLKYTHRLREKGRFIFIKECLYQAHKGIRHKNIKFHVYAHSLWIAVSFGWESARNIKPHCYFSIATFLIACMAYS